MEAATGTSEIVHVALRSPWIRRGRRWTAVPALFAAANAVFYAVVFGYEFTKTRSDEIVFAVLAGGLMTMGLVGGSALVAIRMLRAGVHFDADGVTVRGPLRTWRVGLREAERFVPARQPGFHGGELLRCTFGVVLQRPDRAFRPDLGAAQCCIHEFGGPRERSGEMAADLR